ncbi:MAG: rhomboid family intramembrane serine protease [Candidatus Eisenbacteria bacterium]
MFPIRDDNPAQRPPVVTRALIVLNLVVFLFELSLGPDQVWFLHNWGLVPSRLMYGFLGALPLQEPVTTVFTSMFLHAGWLHLIGNLWYLWIFGDNVEDRIGRVRFVLFYLAGGLASAGLHVLLHPWSEIPVVGASGAIAAVLGAYAVLFPRARVVTLVPIFFFFQIVALPALLVLGLWFVFQFLSGTLALSGAGGGVAWWAHIGGFVFGMVTVAFLKRREQRSAAWVEE